MRIGGTVEALRKKDLDKDDRHDDIDKKDNHAISPHPPQRSENEVSFGYCFRHDAGALPLRKPCTCPNPE